jgi:hypothetical protein
MHRNSDQVRLRLHAEFRIGHAAIDGKVLERFSGIFFHGIENCFGLVASCFQGGANNMAFLGVLSDAD